MNLVLAGRLAVALVLAVAGVRKLGPGGRAQLAMALADYAILPGVLIGAVARMLPWLELSLGVLLGLGLLLVPVSVCASGLLGGFAIAVAWNLRRGRRFKCGCGHGGTINWFLAARDLALCLISAAVAVYPHAALTVWIGPGWIQAAPGSFVSRIPVLMTVLLLAAALRLIGMGSALISRSAARSSVSAVG
ncbi:MAG: hypothetical protein KGL15_09880 [Acidobacteriota bacterium]|nr:hypothetical protein [Acidobacteriota bacterium]